MALRTKPNDPLLSAIEVTGFKSHIKTSRVDFRGLTLLCGANSSGKSSVMQPLLLLKQTIDALPYDYGALKLDGPNVAYTSPAQFMSSPARKGKVPTFALSLELGPDIGISAAYVMERDEIDLLVNVYRVGATEITLHPGGVASAEALAEGDMTSVPRQMLMSFARAGATTAGSVRADFPVARSGAFLAPNVAPLRPVSVLQRHLSRLMHLPGLRGNPSRQYSMMAIGRGQPGHFHDRAAAVVASWEKSKDARLKQLGDAMRQLGLTWKVSAKKVDATSIELLVGRTAESSQGGAHDLVSIADVGFGVSQTLPVVVALVAAEPGQIVYVEQPEIHLHPRAQKAMADLIAAAVGRGARVVVETHSEIIVTRIQALIAEDTLAAGNVVAHWFKRDARTGASTLTRAEPGVDGSLGDWPADFADVAAEVDLEYADAAFDKLPRARA